MSSLVSLDCQVQTITRHAAAELSDADLEILVRELPAAERLLDAELRRRRMRGAGRKRRADLAQGGCNEAS